MRAKLNKLFFSGFLLLLFGLQSFAQIERAADKWTGIYSGGHRFGLASITLQANGIYSSESGSDDGTLVTQSGTYVFSDNLLRFTITKSVLKRGGGEETEINLLDPQHVKEEYGEKEDGEITREYNLIPIEWFGRIYLLNENSLQQFVNAVNLGLEPRSTVSSEPYYGLFYLREGDEQKKVSGHPSLPARWQSFLLNRPVTAKIIAIKFQGADKIGIINRGRRSGLKVGMKLVGIGGELRALYKNDGYILSVQERTATIQIVDLKVGNLLSSRYAAR